MTTQNTRTGGLIFGLILIAFGILFLLDQLFRIAVIHYTWPLIIVGIGALFFAGMFTREREAGGLAIPGTMIVMLGLIFLYQVFTGHWSSWAYSWALIAPTGTGIGLIIYGWWSDRPALRQVGGIVTLVGLVIFLVLGAFFELMTSLFGFVTPGRFLWPVVMIVIGVLLLFGKRWLRLMPMPPARHWIVDSPVAGTPQRELTTEVKDLTPTHSS